jgi:hypothetical protein
VPLGLLNFHSFTREPGSLGQDKDASRALEEKESVRWVDGFAKVNELAERLRDTRLTYIADREGDIYDLFVEAPCPASGADWLVRVQHQQRLLADGRAPFPNKSKSCAGRSRRPHGPIAPCPTSPSPRCSPPRSTRPPMRIRSIGCC